MVQIQALPDAREAAAPNRPGGIPFFVALTDYTDTLTPAAAADEAERLVPAAPQRREKILPFSIELGRRTLLGKLVGTTERILTRTLFRPFMRYLPPVVERLTIPVTGLPAALEGFTFVQLSDFHHSQIVPLRVIEQTVEATNRLNAQAVFLTGDFVTSGTRYVAGVALALSRLRARRGVYAILGNHDYWSAADEVTKQLRERGIAVLLNEARAVTPDLWVAGVDDAWSGHPDLDAALQAVPPGKTTILLAHEPDFADQAQGRGLALQLSGHSHGGQVRLPIINRPLLPYLSWKYYAGLQQAGDLPVYINRGLGAIHPPLLFTCRPEISLFRLTRA